MLLVVAGALALGTSACSMLAPAYRDGSGQVTATASVDASALKVGDCIYNVSNLDDTISKVQVVPCSSDHEAEVFATESNVANTTSDIEQFCTDQFQAYVGIDFNDSDLDVTYIHNDASSSKTDVQCILYSEGTMVTTSYKGSQQ
ncbi:MAG: hypothetical protein FWF28_09035 [Micrococcales bacterium]|nr:hypothetical protein [Micrococcales bacterium]